MFRSLHHLRRILQSYRSGVAGHNENGGSTDRSVYPTIQRFANLAVALDSQGVHSVVSQKQGPQPRSGLGQVGRNGTPTDAGVAEDDVKRSGLHSSPAMIGLDQGSVHSTRESIARDALRCIDLAARTLKCRVCFDLAVVGAAGFVARRALDHGIRGGCRHGAQARDTTAPMTRLSSTITALARACAL